MVKRLWASGTFLLQGVWRHNKPPHGKILPRTPFSLLRLTTTSNWRCSIGAVRGDPWFSFRDSATLHTYLTSSLQNSPRIITFTALQGVDLERPASLSPGIQLTD